MQEIFDNKDTYFLNLGNKCNNNCWFCTNEEENKRFEDIKEIEKKLETASKKGRLIITGEPTIHPNLFDILDLINKRGFKDTVITTNSRMFSHIDFCKKVLAKGLNSFIVKINGHNEQIHDPLTRVKNSFAQTVKGIKNLIYLGADISALITVTEQNFIFIDKIIKKAEELGIKEALICTVIPKGAGLNNYDKLSLRYTEINQVLMTRENSDVNLFIENMPKCIPRTKDANYIDFFKPTKKDKIKLDKCEECIKNLECSGFYPEYLDKYTDFEIKPVNHPEEIAIEVNYDCNLDCPLCFNQNYARKDKQYFMSIDKIKKIIDDIPQDFVSHIRITGGEPLLREDIFEILEYIKNKGFEIWLNTNGTLINEETAERLTKYVKNILLPLNGYDIISEFDMTQKNYLRTR